MVANVKKHLSPVLFVSHGGGPLPLLGDKQHVQLVSSLQEIAAGMQKPAAILVISAHWETLKPTVTTGPNPSLIYDYSGFPKSAYEITYPVKGQPAIAAEILSMLSKDKIAASQDPDRGFDHGVFVPLKIMYPDASIPCVQLSLCRTLDPAEHLQVGRVLAELRRSNVMIIGSGFSFHNLKAFFSTPTRDEIALNESFERWLIDACTDSKFNYAARAEKLAAWSAAPGAKFCHPREEHLIPLHVCVGAAQSVAKKVFEFDVMGRKACHILW